MQRQAVLTAHADIKEPLQEIYEYDVFSHVVICL